MFGNIASWGSVGNMCSSATLQHVGAACRLQSCLQNALPGSGEVARVLQRVSFRLRLPGLTAIMGRFTKQGQWAVSLEIFQGLPELGLQMDTAICNAGLAACMRGCAWSEAKAIFDLMVLFGITIDHITYSTMLSVPKRRRLWPVVIDVSACTSQHVVFMSVELGIHQKWKIASTTSHTHLHHCVSCAILSKCLGDVFLQATY
jgi:hypothetical protein